MPLEEGPPEPADGAKSPWPMVKDGVHVFAFDVNDEVLSFDPANPYSFTYRVISTKAPPFRGVTGAIEVREGAKPNTSVLSFVGHFDNKAPAFLIRFILKRVVLGRRCKAAAREYKREGEYPAKYTGPRPPPGVETGEVGVK